MAMACDYESALICQTKEIHLEPSNGLTLCDIPEEVFVHICTYVNIEDIYSLEKTCRLFSDVISNNNYWRRWLKRKMSGRKCRPFEDDIEIDWRKEALYTDSLSLRWRKDNLICIEPQLTQYGIIDAILLKNDGAICITGSRDHSISLWNVKDIFLNNTNPDEDAPSFVVDVPEAHQAWIWDFATSSIHANFFYSASWDRTVKLWDLTSDILHIQTFRCGSTALCVTCVDENVCAVGLYSPDLIICDRRVGEGPVSKCRVHGMPVLNVKLPISGDDAVYTTSEDGTVGVLDLRVLKVRKRVTLPQPEEPEGAKVYGMKMDLNEEFCKSAVFVGDNKGKLHLLNRETLEVRHTTALWDRVSSTNKITGLVMDYGGLAVSSIKGDVKIMHLSDPPDEVFDIPKMDEDMASISFQNHILAAAYMTPKVRFWIPRNNVFRS